VCLRVVSLCVIVCNFFKKKPRDPPLQFCPDLDSLPPPLLVPGHGTFVLVPDCDSRSLKTLCRRRRRRRRRAPSSRPRARIYSTSQAAASTTSSAQGRPSAPPPSPSAATTDGLSRPVVPRRQRAGAAPRAPDQEPRRRG
jgi:hypothetical protein